MWNSGLAYLLQAQKVESQSGPGQYVWIFALGSFVVGLTSFLFARYEASKRKEKEARTWMNSVVANTNELGATMGVSRLNLTLENIGRIAKGAMELAVNPFSGIAEMEESIRSAANKLDSILNEGSPSYSDIISSFQNDVRSIVDRYYVSFHDVLAIAHLCEANSFDEMRAEIDKCSISKDLRLAISAAFDCSQVFDRGRIIRDIIGLTFIDGEFPDFENELRDLASRFGKSFLSETVKKNTQFWADHSSSEAMYEKAESDLERKSYEEAFRLFHQAATAGLPEAEYRLGEIYHEGKGCSQNPEKAFYWFKKAADQGLPIANYALGVCYEHGDGCGMDVEKAVYHFKLASLKNYQAAMLALGLLYYNQGIDKEKGRALIWRVALLSNTTAQEVMGSILFNEGDPNYYLWFKLASDNNDPHGMLSYGLYLLNSTDNHGEGLELIKRSAESGIPDAQFHLGINYVNGYYCDKKIDEGVNWLEEAAKNGNAIAQCEIGKCYYNGIGRKKDRKKAEYYFMEAIKNNYNQAYVGIGMLKYDDFAFEEAKECFEIAATAGDLQALLLLSKCYSSGIGAKEDSNLASYFKGEADRRSESEERVDEPLNNIITSIMERIRSLDEKNADG